MAQTQPARPAAASHASKAKSKKRARGGEDGNGNRSGSQKRRKPAPEREDFDLDFDLEAGLNKKIGLLDNMLLADHLAQKTRRFGSDLKPVELSALDISRETFSHIFYFIILFFFPFCSFHPRFS